MPVCRPLGGGQFGKAAKCSPVSVHLLRVFETLHEKLSLSQLSSFRKLGDRYFAGLLQRTEIISAKHLVRRVRETGALCWWSERHRSPDPRQQKVAPPGFQTPWPGTALGQDSADQSCLCQRPAPRPHSAARLRPRRPEAQRPGELRFPRKEASRLVEPAQQVCCGRASRDPYPELPPGLREPRGKGPSPRRVDGLQGSCPKSLAASVSVATRYARSSGRGASSAAQPAAASRSAPKVEGLSRELGASTPWCRRGGTVAVLQFPGWSPRVPIPQPPPLKSGPRVSPASPGSGAGSQTHATQLSPFLP